MVREIGRGSLAAADAVAHGSSQRGSSRRTDIRLMSQLQLRGVT